MADSKISGLSLSGCRQRQQRLLERLRDDSLDAAFLTDRRYVHYLSGYWHAGRPIWSQALLLKADGSTVLVLPFEAQTEVAADQIAVFPASMTATIIDDQPAALMEVLRPHLKGVRRIGCDQASQPWLLEEYEIRDLTGALLALRRTKDPDEVELLKVAISACDAAYARAKEILAPGLTEVELYALMYAAAVQAVGESITELGNDFQYASPGGLPRVRPAQAGELAILDVSVVVRGYSSDVCRTFAIGPPTDDQVEAHRLVMQAVKHAQSTIRAGVSCKTVYEQVFGMLNGQKGWVFPHHLGHGIGLSAHEAPRLNPNWDDTFQVGDVFTAEPGLYGDNLQGGIRIEHDYLVTADGLECLSHFPTDL